MYFPFSFLYYIILSIIIINLQLFYLHLGFYVYSYSSALTFFLYIFYLFTFKIWDVIIQLFVVVHLFCLMFLYLVPNDFSSTNFVEKPLSYITSAYLINWSRNWVGAVNHFLFFLFFFCEKNDSWPIIIINGHLNIYVY